MNFDCNLLGFDGEYNDEASDGKITFKPDTNMLLNGVIPPGEYEVTIEGSINGHKKTTTFIIELLDPCDAPESLVPASEWTPSIKYTMTDMDKGYEAPEFVITPSFCPFEVVCTKTPEAFPGGSMINLDNEGEASTGN
jgi:hypothetical protein